VDELQRGAAAEKPVDPTADAKQRLAQQAYDKGQKAWEQGRWIDAARHFADAYAQQPRPEYIYNVGASLHKAGDTMGAVKAYQQYLNARPDAPDADRVRKAIQILLERSGDALMRPGD
jgi:outer membrane protein assembly factor BamD (BamD/ComL family)